MIDGDALGTAVKDIIESLTEEEKQDLELVWQAVCNEIANAVNPYLVTLPVLESWTDILIFQNGWINYDTSVFYGAGFYKDPYNRVFLRGCIKSGSANGLFYLPTGYRPARTERFATIESGVLSEISIAPSGLISRLSGGNLQLHLSGISFRV